MSNGAWETPQASVLGAVLHVDIVTYSWAIGIRNLILPNGQFIGLSGMPYDMARNSACMRALECGASHIFFIDSDVIAPPDTVLRLLAHNAPVVSGMYCRRSPPAGVPVAIKDGKWLTDFKQGSTVEVDFVGAGCLLIRRDVLEQLPPSSAGRHWFHWRVDMRGANVFPDNACMSEDFVFCQNVREKLGHRILLDTSIVARHIGLAQATFGSFVPLDYAA